MLLDTILILITLTVAVIGTLLKDPSRRVKGFLIGLAVAASLASIVKAFGDASDKEFMKRAVVSGLTPANSAYQNFTDEIERQVAKKKFAVDTCHHSSDGMTCFMTSTADKTKHADLVFDRAEIAEMYANDIGHASNDRPINVAFTQQYDTKNYREDFTDKIGLVGTGVVFSIYGTQADYSYGDDFGVRIIYAQKGEQKELTLAPDEIHSFSEHNAPDLFYAVERKFREKVNAQVPQTGND